LLIWLHPKSRMRFAESFKRQAVLGHVSGIPVRADYRWFFVVGLMSAITAASVNPLVGNIAGSVVLGIATTLVFFASIFFHEFAHAVAARWEKLEVVEIVLHPFGGLTRFRRPPETPRAEFRVAIAGPAASFILTLFFLGLMAAANAGALDILAILLFLLALSNFLLAVFNLFPGYPLDGGRVLRAYLWKNGKDLTEATILTGRCGQVIAVGLIVLGMLFVIVYGEFFTGFWAVLAGLFLYDSAKSILREIEASRAVHVDDVMQLPVSVDPGTTIHDLVDRTLPLHRQTVFAVAKDKHFYGMLLLEDLKRIDRSVWSKTLVRDAMRPVTVEQFVETGTPIREANDLAAANGCGAVAVIDKAGFFVGVIMGGIVKPK
ncbi:MAG TPA: site-2 protease family protein, partial [Pyrinomonadaceae bacterium]|nr:site-2 protease family protein [Pyrinomonadaceae bacterium]